MKTTAQRFSVALFLLAIGATGCSTTEGIHSTSDVQDLTEGADEAATPEQAAERFVALLADGTYDGKTPEGKACEVVVEWFDDEPRLSASVQDFSCRDCAQLGEPPISFEVHPEYRLAGFTQSATTISNYVDGEDSVSFTVAFEGIDGETSADVRVAKDDDGNLSLKTTTEERGIECKGLVARDAPRPFG